MSTLSLSLPTVNGQWKLTWHGMNLKLTIEDGYITYARIVRTGPTWIAQPW